MWTASQKAAEARVASVTPSPPVGPQAFSRSLPSPAGVGLRQLPAGPSGDPGRESQLPPQGP